MGVSVYVEAIKDVGNDTKLMESYNQLLDLEQWDAANLIAKNLRERGYEVEDEVPFAIDGSTVEISMYGKGEGEVEYGDGLVLKMSDFPENTVGIRIHMA